MFLRTIGGTACVGTWYGAYGQYFIGWMPMPKWGEPEGVDDGESGLSM